MDNSKLAINSILEKLNMAFEQYITSLNENSKRVVYYENKVYEIMSEIKDLGYIFTSYFYTYISKRIKRLNQLNRRKRYESLSNNPFKFIKIKYREVLTKQELHNYLETCIPGANFTLKSVSKKIIDFNPTLLVITSTKDMIYEEFDID